MNKESILDKQAGVLEDSVLDKDCILDKSFLVSLASMVTP